MNQTDVPAASVRGIQGQAFDIQAIVGSGFVPLRHCTYWLFHIADATHARAWLKSVIDHRLVQGVAELGSAVSGGPATQVRAPKHEEIVMVAISYAGLKALNIEESDDFPFPTPFRMGMTSAARAALLGDVAVDDWKWVDAAREKPGPPVHLLVAHYRSVDAIDDASPFGKAALAASKLIKVDAVKTCPSYAERVKIHGEKEWHGFEPFGFRDGIGQPSIEGLRGFRGKMNPSEPETVESRDGSIEPGEFVLGHPTEYGELAYCPDVKNWPSRMMANGLISTFGLNGSYLAVRQISQDLGAFRDFDRDNPSVNGEPSLVERMIGRRKDGRPILDCPAAPSSIDDFQYRMADYEGFQCPRGAHIRRANPRDNLGWNSESGIAASRLHRLLRRGRVYVDSPACESVPPHPACESVPPHPACGDPRYRESCGKGLFFMALNGDLERQFELVQKRWITNTSFADLSGQSDPLLGTSTPSAFSVPGTPLGRRIEGFASFTRVVGGGYFFVPSLSALGFIAGVLPANSPDGKSTWKGAKTPVPEVNHAI